MQGLKNREAYFVCVLCWWDGQGEPIWAEGRCDGRILHEAAGQEGFGYDPVFEPMESPGLSLAQLGTDFKKQHSHRAMALRNLYQRLLAR
jgi:XTP/dITP diphosphohydrolase